MSKEFKFHKEFANIARKGVYLNNLAELLEEESASKGGKRLAMSTKILVEDVADLLDKGFLMTETNKGISKDTTVWLLMFNGLLLCCLIAFMTMLFFSVQTLESKVFPTGRIFTEESK